MQRFVKSAMVLGLLFLACKKEKVSKEETEQFLYGAGSTSSSTMESDAFLAMMDFNADPPPGLLGNPNEGNASILRKFSQKMKLFNWNDSIKCFYGTWTHTDVWKEVRDACDRVFYTYWDYVPSQSEPIEFIWKYLDYQNTEHTADLRLFNITFVQETLLATLSADLKSDNNPIANCDFSANYNSESQPISVSFRIEITDIGEYKIDVRADAGYTLEDSVFVGTIEGYIKDYKRNNYTVNYFFDINADSSMVWEFSDSDGWVIHFDFARPVHSEHVGFNPHYMHSLTGYINKDDEKAADLEGEIWVTDPPEDPQHQTWIKIIFANGDEGDFFSYIPRGTLSLLGVKNKIQ